MYPEVHVEERKYHLSTGGAMYAQRDQHYCGGGGEATTPAAVAGAEKASRQPPLPRRTLVRTDGQMLDVCS